MKQAIAALLGSRKFLVTSLAVITLAGFVLAGKMPPADFLANVEKLAMLLVAMIGAEGVAEKWNVPRADDKKIDLTKDVE